MTTPCKAACLNIREPAFTRTVHLNKLFPIHFLAAGKRDADRRTAVNCCCYTPMDREVIPPTRPYPKERLVTYVSEVDDYDDELPPSGK
jgi:hypothetical protein